MSSGTPTSLIQLANESIEVELDVAMGAEVRSIRRPDGPNVLAWYDWTTPLPVRHSTTGDSELDWLSDYRGGWQELFPNAGAPCVVDGARLPFHGEASRAHWEVVELDRDRVTLRTAARLPLVLERSMRVVDDPPALLVEETVHSDAPVPTAFLIGQHPAFLASEGARIDLPTGSELLVDEHHVTDLVDVAPGEAGTWPTVPGRNGGSVELDRVPTGPVQRLVYLSELGVSPWAAIRDIHPGLGVALAWDAATYRCAWFWWEIGGPEYPWYGRARIVAIEPATAMPSDGLAAARSRGTAHELAAGAEHHTWLTLSLFDADERAVTGVRRDGTVTR